jgi:hypothetical protein
VEICRALPAPWAEVLAHSAWDWEPGTRMDAIMFGVRFGGVHSCSPRIGSRAPVARPERGKFSYRFSNITLGVRSPSRRLRRRGRIASTKDDGVETGNRIEGGGRHFSDYLSPRPCG